MKKMTLFLAVSLFSSLVFAQTKIEISASYKTPVNGMMRVVYPDNYADSIPIINGKFNYVINTLAPIRVFLFARFKNRPKGVSTAGVSLYLDRRASLLELDTVTVKKEQSKTIETKITFLQKSIFQEKFDLLESKLSKLDVEKEQDKEVGGKILTASLGKGNTELENCIMLDLFSRFLERDKLKAFYDGFNEQAKASMYGVRIKNELIPKYTLKVGDVLPHFSQQDSKGNLVNISDLKGKYVLIDFWASWCVPCRAENPNLVKAYQKFKDNDFEILGVSLDVKKDDWLEAIAKDNLPWMQVSDLNGWENQVSKMFGIPLIPSSILVDKEGKILALNLRGEELNKKLEEILK